MDETYILTFALYIENTSLYYILDKLCATSKKVQQHSVGLGLSKARDCFLSVFIHIIDAFSYIKVQQSCVGVAGSLT
jgi:hypothetical protein